MDRHGTQSGKLTGINKGDALLGGAARLWPLRLMSLLADEHETQPTAAPATVTPMMMQQYLHLI
ncbi:hypothetical protein EMIT0158MI4_150061 [Burkholderia ambifaria]